MTKIQNDPTVSVIIPTYNRAHLIGRAVKSVLNQTYQDFEIIVVDDGSTDNTEEVVKSFNDKRIKYIRHEKNKGAAAARNIGIKIAKGEYIAFQDSDDEWLSEKLEKQMEVFENAPARVGVVYTGLWKIENNRKIYIPSPKIKKKEGNIHNVLLEGNYIGTPATLVLKKCFEKVGMFDERLQNLVDWEMWLRISKFYKFKFIDEPLVIVHCQQDSICTNQNTLIRSLKLILKTHLEDFKEGGKRLLSKQYCYLGDLLCQNEELSHGREYILKAISVYPFNIRYLLAVLVTFLGQSTYNKTIEKYRKIRNGIASLKS